MILDEVASFLVAQGLGTLSTDLFKGQLPASPDNVVCLRETGGLAPVLVHEVAGISRERAGLQVLCRGPQSDYLTARSRAKQVFDALVAVTNKTLSGVLYLSIQALQQPFYMHNDENDRPIIVFNVIVEKSPS